MVHSMHASIDHFSTHSKRVWLGACSPRCGMLSCERHGMGASASALLCLCYGNDVGRCGQHIIQAWALPLASHTAIAPGCHEGCYRLPPHLECRPGALLRRPLCG